MTLPTFVWDLDGTLIDSYPAIMRALEATYVHFGWTFDYDSLYQYVLNYSVGQLLTEKADTENLDLQSVKSYYSADLKKRDHELTLFDDAVAVLEWTRYQGIANFIYTHKGDNTLAVLALLGISHYFVESLHSQSGFARKPHSEAMDYLVEKYHLNRETTYYIGDRQLDMAFAQNSGVHSINLSQKDCQGNTYIKRLQDIADLPYFKDLSDDTVLDQ